MQSYRTCHAAQITHVAVGQSTLPSVNAPANNVGSQRQQEDAAAVASRRGYVVAPGPATPESAVAFQANDRGSINPNLNEIGRAHV